jgi:hypothetical protein
MQSRGGLQFLSVQSPHRLAGNQHPKQLLTGNVLGAAGEAACDSALGATHSELLWLRASGSNWHAVTTLTLAAAVLGPPVYSPFSSTTSIHSSALCPLTCSLA